MCGIFGMITSDDRSLGEVLLEAGRRLAYRGYDSIGCATLDGEGRTDLRKDVGRIDDVDARLHFAEMKGRRGMVQLRWATFGAPSPANAQPHYDSDGDLVGAHNGNIVNQVALREEFLSEGMTVRGTNDGESCVHAVERYVDRGYAIPEAIRMATRDLQGDYAFVITHVDDDALYAVKQGSGLVAAVTDDAAFVASDLPCILPLSRNMLSLEDGEMVVLRPGHAEVYKLTNGSRVDRQPEEVNISVKAAEKGGYPHFMLKEIHEQPQVATELLHWLDASPDVQPFIDEMASARRLYLVGCGTSYHACLLGAAQLNRVAGIPAVADLAPRFRETLARNLGPEDVVVWVSQSGETKDVLSALKATRPSGARSLAVFNVLGSSLMRAADRYLPLACGYEVSVPATKTYLNQALLFSYIADRLNPTGGTTPWNRFPLLVENTLTACDAQVRQLADELVSADDLYCLGYGVTYGVALEGALKLKEVTYAHCEGMLSSEFKHGPLSAVTDGYPVLFVTIPEDTRMIVSHVSEVACRGGRTIAFGPADPLLQINVDSLVEVQDAGPVMTPLLAVLPLQLLSYHASVARGLDPDFPRNLSKTLTVD